MATHLVHLGAVGTRQPSAVGLDVLLHQVRGALVAPYESLDEQLPVAGELGDLGGKGDARGVGGEGCGLFVAFLLGWRWGGHVGEDGGVEGGYGLEDAAGVAAGGGEAGVGDGGEGGGDLREMGVGEGRVRWVEKGVMEKG